MRKIKFDIECEALTNYFLHQLDKITEEGKGNLPPELLMNIFKGQGKYSKAGVSKLNFLARLYVLARALKVEWLIMVKDERGMTIDQFQRLKDRILKKSGTIEDAETLFSTGELVLADKELFDSYKQINGLSVSPAYNYVSRIKNVPSSKTGQWRQKSQYLARFLINHETNKRKIFLTTNLTLPEYYVLMALYHGKDTPSSSLYKEVLKGVYNANRGQIQKAFTLLKQKGFIEQVGEKRRGLATSLRITNTGISKVDEIMQKYIINC